MHFLWQDLPIGTKFSDLVTFNLHIENFNLGDNFLTIRGRLFIFHMCIPCDKTFPLMLKLLTLWTWPWHLTTVVKNFNLDHYFRTITVRSFIFHMCIPCDKTFPLVPKFETLTVTFYLYFKNFNLVYKFWTVRGSAFIFYMCISCWSCALHCDIWPLFWKLEPWS